MSFGQRGLKDWAEEFFETDSHARYCAVQNTRSALFFVGAFLLAGLGGWIGLHKVVMPPDWPIFVFEVIVVAGLVKMMVDFKCLRERIGIGITIVILAMAQVERIAPSIFGAHVRTERLIRLVLALTGLAISLSMLVQSLTSPKPAGMASH